MNSNAGVWVNPADANSERLAILIEEASEVQQMACKILRHGWGSHNPFDEEKIPNRRLLEKEVGDFLFAMELLISYEELNRNAIEVFKKEKAKKIEKYLHFNQTISEWLDEQPIPIPLNKIDDEWIEQIERVLEIEETNVEKAHMQQLIDLLYKYYKTTVLRDDYTQQLKELLLITDCPEILIENPGLFSKKNPDEKAMEWARGKIKIFTDSLSAQQPIPVHQDDYWQKRCEAAEDLLSVMDWPKNFPDTDNVQFKLAGDRNEVWQKSKYPKPEQSPTPVQEGLKEMLVMKDYDGEFEVWSREHYNEYISMSVKHGGGSAYKIVSHFNRNDDLLFPKSEKPKVQEGLREDENYWKNQYEDAVREIENLQESLKVADRHISDLEIEINNHY